MKRSMILLLVSGAVLLGLAGVLLFSLGSGPDEPSVPEDQPPPGAQRLAPEPQAPSPTPAPAAPPTPGPQPAATGPGPSEAPAPDASARSLRQTTPEQENAPRMAKAAKASQVALRQQAELYRRNLLTLNQRIDELRASLRRMQASGKASPEAVSQAQRQIQQLIDSGPRARQQLEQLEQQLKASEESKPDPGK